MNKLLLCLLLPVWLGSCTGAAVMEAITGGPLEAGRMAKAREEMEERKRQSRDSAEYAGASTTSVEEYLGNQAQIDLYKKMEEGEKGQAPAPLEPIPLTPLEPGAPSVPAKVASASTPAKTVIAPPPPIPKNSPNSVPLTSDVKRAGFKDPYFR